jgi:hypothetical protein
MSKMGILGQPGGVLSFSHNVLVWSIFGFSGPFLASILANPEFFYKTLNTPRLARNAPFEHLSVRRG